MKNDSAKVRVFLSCSGLGNVNRGYESFTQECFEAIAGEKLLEVYLLKGGGNSSGREFVIRNFRRNGTFAKALARLTGKEPYYLEQLSFCVGMLPAIIRYKPSVIYFSDFLLGTFLWHLRTFFRFKYKLLFSNGAPNGPPYSRVDHVQQLLPFYVRDAVAAGEPEEKQSLLPYAVDFTIQQNQAQLGEQFSFRNKLQLPTDKKIILSVGAVNSHHKRMDYVISEFSKLDASKYFLVILGQIDEASQSIIEEAKKLLSPDSYLIKQVQKEQVIDYLFATNYFILASFHEGLPRVLIEALSTGLTPIVHDYIVTRETLGDKGVFMDLSKPAVLQEALQNVDELNNDRNEVISTCWREYSWEQLTPQYIKLIYRSLA